MIGGRGDFEAVGAQEEVGRVLARQRGGQKEGPLDLGDDWALRVYVYVWDRSMALLGTTMGGPKQIVRPGLSRDRRKKTYRIAPLLLHVRADAAQVVVLPAAATQSHARHGRCLLQVPSPAGAPTAAPAAPAAVAFQRARPSRRGHAAPHQFPDDPFVERVVGLHHAPAGREGQRPERLLVREHVGLYRVCVRGAASS